jgi:hypothetical protein
MDPGEVATTSPAVEKPPLLSYGRPASRFRRWIRWLLLLLWIAGFLGLAYDKWGVEARLLGKVVYRQHECLAHTEPADRVAIDLDPSRRSILLSQPGYRAGPRAPIMGWISGPPQTQTSSGGVATIYHGMDDLREKLERAHRHWEVYQRVKEPERNIIDLPAENFPEYGTPPFADETFVMFLHARSAGNKPARLVALIGGWHAEFDGVELESYVSEKAYLRPGRALTGGPGEPRGTVLHIRSPDKSPILRLFAGQPDPDDSSRFTVRYQSSAGDGTIEGRLTGDDTVMLRVLDGPMKDGF